MVLVVKNLPTNAGIRSLDWEDPLEEGTATHSSILAWKIPMDRGAWRALTVKTWLKQLSTAYQRMFELQTHVIVLAPWSPLSFHVYVMVRLCIASYGPREGLLLSTGLERVTGKKARSLQTQKIACKYQTFFKISLLRGRRKQTSVAFFPFSIRI